MLADAEAFSGLGCEDIERAREFYEQTLGVRTTVLDAENGLVNLDLAGGRETLLYQSPGSISRSTTSRRRSTSWPAAASSSSATTSFPRTRRE